MILRTLQNRRSFPWRTSRPSDGEHYEIRHSVPQQSSLIRAVSKVSKLIRACEAVR